MLGFELRVEKWLKHGDSEKVEPFRYESNQEIFCCICHHHWREHGKVKISGELVCPDSWVLKDYDDVIDEGDFNGN